MYQYVENPKKLMDEIFRVLVPGGTCYFGAPTPVNRWIAKDRNPTQLLNHRRLQKLCHRFIVHPCAAEILKDPEKYQFYKLIPYAWMTALVPECIWKVIEPWSPTVVWLLEKPQNTSGQFSRE